MRVLFVSSHAQPGGSEAYLARLLALMPPGEVAGVVSLQHGPLNEELGSHGWEPRVLPIGAGPGEIVLGARRLRTIVRRVGPTVVHANGLKAALVSVLATRRKPPVVWLKHDVSHDGRLALWVGRRCALVVGVSSFVVEVFRGTDVETRVVHTGLEVPAVDRERATAQVDAATDHGARPVVTLLGRLDPLKGHREALAAWPRVRAVHPNATLLFVGADSPTHPGWRAQLEEEIDAAGLVGSVLFMGYRSDALELLAGSDVVVVPSVMDERGSGAEGFPLGALEALGVGTPVAGYDHGGLPEVVGDCGALVPPGDREALAGAILELLGEPRRSRASECGRERIATRFGLDAMVKQLRDAYGIVRAR